MKPKKRRYKAPRRYHRGNIKQLSVITGVIVAWKPDSVMRANVGYADVLLVVRAHDTGAAYRIGPRGAVQLLATIGDAAKAWAKTKEEWTRGAHGRDLAKFGNDMVSPDVIDAILVDEATPTIHPLIRKGSTATLDPAHVVQGADIFFDVSEDDVGAVADAARFAALRREVIAFGLANENGARAALEFVAALDELEQKP